MDYVRKNLFQRLTLQWDGLQPYNAAQLMRIRPLRTHDAIDSAWQSTLLALGLGGIQRRGRGYRHVPQASAVAILPPGTDADDYVSEQMNTRFDLDREGPFRAFVIPARETQTLGIIYHHWVADSVSIRTLMREWFYRIIGQAGRDSSVPILMPESGLRRLLNLPAELIAAEHYRRRIRTVRRLSPEQTQNLTVAHRLVELPEHSATLLRAAAHDYGVKVTDLLLASIARVCAQHLPARQSHRPDLAIGCIRDLRPSFAVADDAFGACLGYSTVICPQTVLQNGDHLIQHIAAETRKGRNAPPRVGNCVHVALAAGAILNRQRLLEFYRKRVPLSAGLSNVDLTKTWVGQHHRDQIVSFHRVSPTGPNMPLAIATTTLGRDFNICFTWRQSVFTQTTIAAFIADFLQDLHAWTARPETLAVYEPAA